MLSYDWAATLKLEITPKQALKDNDFINIQFSYKKIIRILLIA